MYHGHRFVSCLHLNSRNGQNKFDSDFITISAESKMVSKSKQIEIACSFELKFLAASDSDISNEAKNLASKLDTPVALEIQH